MKAIRITFQTIEDDSSVGLESRYVVKRAALTVAPILPVEAAIAAQKFWDVVVMMGLLEGAE